MTRLAVIPWSCFKTFKTWPSGRALNLHSFLWLQGSTKESINLGNVSCSEFDIFVASGLRRPSYLISLGCWCDKGKTEIRICNLWFQFSLELFAPFLNSVGVLFLLSLASIGARTNCFLRSPRVWTLPCLPRWNQGEHKLIKTIKRKFLINSWTVSMLMIE